MIKRKKTLELILDIGLIVTFLMLNVSLILKFSCLLIADYKFTSLRGNSMTPTVMHGDTVLIKRDIGIEDIQVGDIISFRTDLVPAPILHRVIEIEKEPVLIFRTKGDANEDIDITRTTADQVIGKMIYVIPTSLLLTPLVLFVSILLSVIPLLMKVAYCLHKRNTVAKEHQPPILNTTTILLMAILQLSGVRLLVQS